MSAHFAFSGKATRVTVFGFFEHNGLNLALQEQYYKWWYDWAKDLVMRNPDLRQAKGAEFAHYPYGQHAYKNFHLHDYQWASALIDLGSLIENAIFPRLNDLDRDKLQEAHKKMLNQLRAQRQSKPRPPAPDVGRYRHV